MASLTEKIDHMVNHGSSLTINWGEDTGCYEVDWITGGVRFRGVNRNLQDAMVEAIRAARDRFGYVPVSAIG